MEYAGLAVVDVAKQLDLLERRAKDDRPVIQTGFPGLDSLLHRGGFQPGNLVLLGGRMHTRKTAVMTNMAANMLRAGISVGMVTLDESVESYTVKLMSAFLRQTADYIELAIRNEPQFLVETKLYEDLAQNLTMSQGIRPSTRDLTQWVNSIDGERPRVVFIDYTSLLVHYRGKKENERVASVMEDLQTWTHDQEVVTIALHQVGRADDGTGKKNHGDVPNTAESLLYGGENQADIILATYRPTLGLLGNLSRQAAEWQLGENFDEEEWQAAVDKVNQTRTYTFLQLVKNRPGIQLCQEGVCLVSPDDSQYMRELADGTDDGANRA